MRSVYKDMTDSTGIYTDSMVVMVMFVYVVVLTGGYMLQLIAATASILGCASSHCLRTGEMDLR